MNINNKLKEYIEGNIFTSYERNDEGHNLKHIKYVIDRSLKFASTIENINYDMVYTIAAYHDIGHYIDAKNHEKVSADMLLNDKKLRDFFTEEEIQIMSEAVYDHRASMEGEPRSIYGKIVSSADRNVLIEEPLRRTYSYRLEHNPDDTLDSIIEESRIHLVNKFGKKGYASEKMYFEDMLIVTGHTPTGFIDPEYTGQIWKGNNHIVIDCGAVFGNPLECICLDTMEEIYVE